MTRANLAAKNDFKLLPVCAAALLTASLGGGCAGKLPFGLGGETAKQAAPAAASRDPDKPAAGPVRMPTGSAAATTQGHGGPANNDEDDDGDADTPLSDATIAGLYKLDHDCPRFLYEGDGAVRVGFDSLRCPKAELVADPAQVRASMRDSMGAGPTAAITHAIYVHVCAVEIEKEPAFYPAMGLRCMWEADHLNLAKVRTDLGPAPEPLRGRMLDRIEASTKAVQAAVKERFPRAANERDYQIFYDLVSKAVADDAARRKKHSAAYAAINAFQAAYEKGEFEGCDRPLRQALTSHMRGARGAEESIAAKLGDEVGYALADALARCYAATDKEAMAAAIVFALRDQRRRDLLGTQLYYLQTDEAAKDLEGAQRMPHLKGKKYCSMTPSDISRPRMPITEASAAWQRTASQLRSGMRIVRGRIARVDKSTRTLYFKSEKVPVVDQRCHETNRIDRIDNEGKIHYREECTYTPKGSTTVQPEPLTVSDVTGVTPGSFVQIVRQGDQYAVYAVADSAERDARIHSLVGLTF